MPKPQTILIDTQIKPDPELEKRTRRVFTTEYKLRILQEAAACRRGELGELLRRERLYHAQLSQWRNEFDTDGVAGLSKSAPGPRASKTPEQKRIEQLEKENARLQKQLLRKEQCLELQKKAIALLDELEDEKN